MPIPKTKDIRKIIRFLKKEKPNMPHRQMIAIALQVARRAGAKIPKKKNARKTKRKIHKRNNSKRS